MTEYGITWSGTRHIVGHRTAAGLPMAACNARTDLYTREEDGTFNTRLVPMRVRDKYDTAPLCKRCAKIEAAS